MKCKNCGTSNLKGAKFCEKCGFSLVETSICPKCGYKNKPAALHCIECGSALAQAEIKPPKSVVAVVPKIEPIRPKKRISPFIWILGGMFGVIILCVAAFLLGLIKVPVPPEPDTSILPEFIVSAWKNTYQFQTTGSLSVPASSPAQVPLQGGYVEALFNCDEKGKSPVTATTQDKIYDFIKWAAVTQAQSEDFLKYIKFDVTVNGNPANYQGPFLGEISLEKEK